MDRENNIGKRHQHTTSGGNSLGEASKNYNFSPKTARYRIKQEITI